MCNVLWNGQSIIIFSSACLAMYSTTQVCDSSVHNILPNKKTKQFRLTGRRLSVSDGSKWLWVTQGCKSRKSAMNNIFVYYVVACRVCVYGNGLKSMFSVSPIRKNFQIMIHCYFRLWDMRQTAMHSLQMAPFLDFTALWILNRVEQFNPTLVLLNAKLALGSRCNVLIRLMRLTLYPF